MRFHDACLPSRSATRHRASTSMYSLTFCVRFLLPERHHWKRAFQTAAEMLRTPPRRQPVAGGPAAPASRMRRAVLGAPPVALSNIGGALCSRPQSLADAHYYTPCSNAANPLKLPGVPQTNETISAASGPKFTILWGHVEEILLLNKFFSNCRYMP